MNPPVTKNKASTFGQQTRKRIFLGLFTLVPIWLTFLLLGVMLQFVHEITSPVINWLTAGIEPSNPGFRFSRSPVFQSLLGITVLLTAFYLTGVLASRWLGRKALELLEDVIDRIPVARNIYKTIKRLADAMQTKSDDFERVVLIEFPTPDMKTVGLVTSTFKDSATGRELAAVYVPTTPNPTSGYLEIVPVENLVPTDWKFDEAMSFIISGGADIPKTFNYEKQAQSNGQTKDAAGLSDPE